jgi:signal transduction histidine kinase
MQLKEGSKQRSRSLDWLPKSILKKASVTQQLLDNYGIKIYNDNVRIMPYGEPGNDWLELENRKVKRSGGRLRLRDCLGWIVLDKVNNTKIEETASRQKIIDTNEFLFLKDDFAIKSIQQLEKYFAELDIDVDKASVHERPVSKTASEVTQLTQFIEKLEIPKVEKDKQTKKLIEINRLVEKLDEEYEEDIEEVTSSLEMYRNLSSMGVTALGFHHEITTPIGNIDGFLDRTIKKWDTMDEVKKIDNITLSHKAAWTVIDLNEYIKAYGTLFTGAKGVMRAREEIDIKYSLERFLDGFKTILDTHKIEFEIVPGPSSFKGLYMNKASFESIIINLMSNSIKALNRVDFVKGRSRKKIRIEYKKNRDKLELRVKDNGQGIEAGNEEEIFTAFWSFPKNKEEGGTGMGTTIIREILEEYDGTINVENTVYEKDEPGKGKTTMLIKIPLSELRKPK